MKVNRIDLSKFLSLISLKGQIQNNELLLTVEKEVIKTLTISEDKSTIIRAKLKGVYDEVEEFGIADLSHFLKTVNIHEQADIDLSLNKNKLILKDKELKSSTILKEAEYIKNTLPEEKFDQVKASMEQNKITLSAVQIAKIIKYFELNASAKREENGVTFTIKKNKLLLKFEGGSENVLEAEFELPNEVQDFQFKMGNVFIEVLMTIREGVDMYVGPNMIGIIIDNDSMSFEFLVATSI